MDEIYNMIDECKKLVHSESKEAISCILKILEEINNVVDDIRESMEI
jgi:hypothetical protein